MSNRYLANTFLSVACYNGDVESVEDAIAAGATDWNWGLRGACVSGKVALVNRMIELGATDWNLGLCGACLGGHVTLINRIIALGATDWDEGLCSACERGHVAIAVTMITRGATDLNTGLFYACRGGYIELTNILIEHGATNWNMGLKGACIGHQYEMAKIMLAHGAEWGTSFNNACEKGSLDIIDMMIKCDVADINSGLYFACKTGRYSVVKKLIALGATNPYETDSCSHVMKEFIKVYRKVYRIKLSPITRMLRRFTVHLHSAKKIQQWWRSILPLRQELSWAQPNGWRFKQSLDNFNELKKSL